MRGKRRVLVVEEGMPNYLERELKAVAHEARLPVEISGKDRFSPYGEYVPHLVVTGLERFLARPEASRRYAALTRHRAEHPPDAPDARGQAAADVLHRLPRAPGLQRDEDPADARARDRRHPRVGRHRLPLLRDPGALQRGQHDPGLRHGALVGGGGRPELRQAGRLDHGRRRLLAQRALQRRRQRGLQQAGRRAGHPGELLHLGDRPAAQPVHRQERPERSDSDDDPEGAPGAGRRVDPHGPLLPHPGADKDPPRGAHQPREGSQGDHRQGRVPARAPAPRAAARRPAGRRRARAWSSRSSAWTPTCAPATTRACA